jgi:multiple sugar transport system substrate-binding protein
LLPVFAFAGGSEEEAPATDEPVTVTIGYNRFLESSFGSGPAPIEVIRNEVSNRYPNITVELNIMPDTVAGMRDAIAVWMTAEEGTVDIYGIDTPWVPEFGRAGWAVPLNDRIPGLVENFNERGLATFSHEGEVLGVPFWGSISGLYYRTDLLEEYGLEAPETYDDMIRISDTITADRPELTAFTWPGAKEESLVMVFADFLYGFGGTYRDEEGNYAFDSDAAVEALSFMKRLIDDGYSPQETTAWRGEESQRRFVEGNAIFTWHNSDLVIWLDDPERSSVAGNWEFTTTPAQPDGEAVGITGGFAFGMNPHSDSPEAAARVLEVIASEAVQKGFALAWGPVQYYEGLYEQQDVLEANPNADKITAVLDSAISRPPSTSYTELSNILQEEIHTALTGGKSPREALEDAQSRIERLR